MKITRSELKNVAIAWIAGGIVLLPVFILCPINVIIPILIILIPIGIAATITYLIEIKWIMK